MPGFFSSAGRILSQNKVAIILGATALAQKAMQNYWAYPKETQLIDSDYNGAFRIEYLISGPIMDMIRWIALGYVDDKVRQELKNRKIYLGLNEGGWCSNLLPWMLALLSGIQQAASENYWVYLSSTKMLEYLDLGNAFKILYSFADPLFTAVKWGSAGLLFSHTLELVRLTETEYPVEDNRNPDLVRPTDPLVRRTINS